MLNFHEPAGRLGRRAFLRIGSLAGLAGLSQVGLPQLLRAGATGGSVVRDRAVVLLHMQGGPSQLETFDPKPDAPVEIRTATDVIGTRLPGVSLGSTRSRGWRRWPIG